MPKGVNLINLDPNKIKPLLRFAPSDLKSQIESQLDIISHSVSQFSIKAKVNVEGKELYVVLVGTVTNKPLQNAKTIFDAYDVKILIEVLKKIAEKYQLDVCSLIKEVDSLVEKPKEGEVKESAEG